MTIQPYRAQGANLAVSSRAYILLCRDALLTSFIMQIEDAEMLGALFSHITSKEQIKEFAMALQSLRAPRCKDAVEGARKNQAMAHMADGPEQQKRDEDMKRGVDTHGRFSALFTYDALAEANKWWEARSA